jgi:dTDP-4-amino-4,6-dideoxygalactose transaminase
MIEFLDLKSSYIELKNEIDQAIARVLNSGWYIGGPEVESFEVEYANYCEAKYAVGVANGLDALHLSLLAMGVGPGDEVIVPSNTYIATWLAVSQCGAVPVPVEPDEKTYNIDPNRIEASITSKTKVILPVLLYGQPTNLDPILAIAKKNGLYVLEDGAQAHGAKYKGSRIGAHSDAVAWSFYPGKNLGAFGDGGAVTTNNQDIAKKISILRNYGSSQKYVNEVRGFNSRLDPLQAAVLRVKLKYLDQWNDRRKNIAKQYLREIKSTDLILPFVPEWADPVWHLFVLRHPERDKFQKALQEKGVGFLIHYPIPPHKQSAYFDHSFKVNNLEIAEKLANEVISIPMGPHLSLEQVDKVAETINNIRS